MNPKTSSKEQTNMKKLKLIKKNEVSFTREASVYCDFCGDDNKPVFTSSFDDRRDGDNRKCEMQICEDCVRQLSKNL